MNYATHMSIGIIGAGRIGSALARAIHRAGLRASICNSRDPSTLAHLEQALGPSVRPATRNDVALSDIVFVAVPWSKVGAALDGLGPWHGQVVVDCNNPLEAPHFKRIPLEGRRSSEIVASHVPGARVVKAFNHLPPDLLESTSISSPEKRVAFVSGDDPEANRLVGSLSRRLGFFPIDLGSLSGGGSLLEFPGGPLPGLNLVRMQ
jgi:predicted dinucleotide-binding enzyme